MTLSPPPSMPAFCKSLYHPPHLLSSPTSHSTASADSQMSWFCNHVWSFSSSCLFTGLCGFVHTYLTLALKAGFSLSGGSLPRINLPYILTIPTSAPSLNYKVISLYPSPHCLKRSSSDWQAACNWFCLQWLYARRCSYLLLLSSSVNHSIRKNSYECWKFW